MPQNKNINKKRTPHFRSPIGELCQKELPDEKIREFEKISDVIDKLDTHYGFYLLKNCFSMPKLYIFCVRALVFCKMILWNATTTY